MRMENKEISPIAVIHTDFPTKFGIPRQADIVKELTGTIVFYPLYRKEEALRGIEGFSHLWLIWGFSQNKEKEFSPTVRPPRLGGNERVGVFASRSPFRPNGLGLSVVRILGLRKTKEEGTVIDVSGIDMADNTPIYDIKPYVPYADSIPGAKGGFSQDGSKAKLAVDFPSSLLARIPKEKQEVLSRLLEQDPRPAYQHDPDRIYGFSFGGEEIRFQVSEDKLTVLSVEKPGNPFSPKDIRKEGDGR